MRDIKELTLEELKGIFAQWEEPGFHARQVFSWIYQKGARDFDCMSDLPSGLRSRLKENFYIFALKLADARKSGDGTEKFLFELKDGNFTPPVLNSKRKVEMKRAGFIEAVLIPAEKRLTGCISSQVGCKFKCAFCASGISGFKRNLTCAEIMEEALYLKNHSGGQKLSHIVFMGTGEPLDNYDNVMKAIRIINSADALNISARRITLSTCGIIPGIRRLCEEGLQIELSVSLHASDDKTRSALMSLNKKYPLKNLIQACREYIEKTNRQITFEYILIKSVNSDLQNARNLVKILRGLRLCKVNLITANPVKELNIEPPNKLDILLFRDCLLKSGINVTLRKPRGADIEAACGQLRLRYEKSKVSV